MDQSTIISLLTQNKSSNFKGRLHCQSRYRLSCMAANPHKRGGFPFSSTSTQSSSSGGGHSAAHWRGEQQTNSSCSRSGKEILITIAIIIIIIGMIIPTPGVRADSLEDIYIHSMLYFRQSVAQMKTKNDSPSHFETANFSSLSLSSLSACLSAPGKVL